MGVVLPRACGGRGTTRVLRPQGMTRARGRGRHTFGRLRGGVRSPASSQVPGLCPSSGDAEDFAWGLSSSH